MDLEGWLILPLECLWRGEVGADTLWTGKKTIMCKGVCLRRNMDRRYQWKVGDTAGMVHFCELFIKVNCSWCFFHVKWPFIRTTFPASLYPFTNWWAQDKDLSIHSLDYEIELPTENLHSTLFTHPMFYRCICTIYRSAMLSKISFIKNELTGGYHGGEFGVGMAE